MFDSLWEQATESDWAEEERAQWYRERPKDEDYYRIQRELLDNGLTRKAKLTQLPPHEEGQPTLWAIGIEGAPAAAGGFAVPPARQRGLRRRAVGPAKEGPGAGMGRGAGNHPPLPQVHQRRGRGALPEVGPRRKLGERAAGPRDQLLWPATAATH